MKRNLNLILLMSLLCWLESCTIKNYQPRLLSTSSVETPFASTNDVAQEEPTLWTSIDEKTELTSKQNTTSIPFVTYKTHGNLPTANTKAVKKKGKVKEQLSSVERMVSKIVLKRATKPSEEVTQRKGVGLTGLILSIVSVLALIFSMPIVGLIAGFIGLLIGILNYRMNKFDKFGEKAYYGFNISVISLLLHLVLLTNIGVILTVISSILSFGVLLFMFMIYYMHEG